MHVVPASFDPELIKREISQNSKAKNHMVITTNTEKVFDKIQHSFMMKNICKTKETTDKMKRKPTEWEKMFVNDMSDR